MSQMELHRPIPTDRISADGLVVTITADPDECAAIARRMAIPAVRKLVCEFRLFRPAQARGGTIVADAHLRASLTRECVVTLENFKTSMDQRFRLRFVPAGQEIDDEDPESDDEIGYDGTALDLGEVAVEQLALDLDPYPRKPGAELPPEANDEQEGPFAALEALARRTLPS
jgi:hypothetical protein